MVKFSQTIMSLSMLFTCGRELRYPRNSYLLQAFQRSFNVTAVVDASRSYPARFARLAPRLLAQRGSKQVFFAGFYGHPLVLYLRRLTGSPILFDPYISTYDTLCFDRQAYRPTSLAGRLVLALDRQSAAQADYLLMDTVANVDYYQRVVGVPRQKMTVVYAGCDETVFAPHPEISEDGQTVLFFGAFLPLQGVDVIVRAAALLKDRPGIRFRILGSGFGEQSTRQLAAQLGATNLEFMPYVPPAELPALISRSMLCLGGHFGDRDKARRYIAGKTFQCLAMGKPTLVGDNPANRELLTHGQDAWMVKMNDPAALAEAVCTLAGDAALRARLGRAARQTFLERSSLAVVSEQLRMWVEQCAAQGRWRTPLSRS